CRMVGLTRTGSTSWGSLVRAQYRPPRKGPAGAGFLLDHEKRRGPGGPLMSAKCQRNCSNSAESRLLDASHQVVTMQRLVELLCVHIECDADLRVSSDFAYPYGVQAKSDDQMRDERAPQVVSRQGRGALAVKSRLFGRRNDSLIANVVAIERFAFGRTKHEL